MVRRTIPALACAALALCPAAAHAIGPAALKAKLTSTETLMGPASAAYVQDLTAGGTTLYAHDIDLPLSPASNDKLLTTATAFLKLGPDATMRTTLAGPEPVDGVVHGDVVLIGGGDPYLRESGLQALASQIASQGITHIKGRILADAGLLDTKVGSYDSAFGYDTDLGGRLSALQIDEGAGADPPMHAARTLHKALEAVGVKLDGLPRMGDPPDGVIELAGVDSAPLSAIATGINVPSDNYGAELLLKDLGASFGGTGTTNAGLSVVRAELASHGIHPTVVDGSGLSRTDKVTVHQIVALLSLMRRESAGPAFAASLPVAGHTGTLKDRLHAHVVRGRCQAKTGTLIGVSALSGYCTTTHRHLIVFSFIENGIDTTTAKRLEDRMVTALARYTG